MTQILFQGIDVNDFIKKISDVFDEKLRIHSEKPKIPQESLYLNRFEVAALLKISLPTLNNWSKSGILQSHRIGNRVLYKSVEIDQAVKEVRNLKYKRA